PCVDAVFHQPFDARQIAKLSGAQTGHANIAVADDGENQIVTFGGTNQQISDEVIGTALAEAGPGDTVLLQNETNGQVTAARMARNLGARVVYAAAPFEAKTVSDIAEYADILVLNAVEAEQLRAALGQELTALGIDHVVVTLGGEGSRWLDVTNGTEVHVPALPVTPVDTTGAGDTFTGYLVAGLDRGMPMEQALRLATQAGAIMVTRLGTADVIPDLKDIEDARL
ncbi:MAG: PfkB family carbohydrate kinase, partial [Pseudomonadota bacterium]